jgi:hypothetical protein
VTTVSLEPTANSQEIVNVSVSGTGITTEHAGDSIREILVAIERLRNEIPSDAGLQAIEVP